MAKEEWRITELQCSWGGGDDDEGEASPSSPGHIQQSGEQYFTSFNHWEQTIVCVSLLTSRAKTKEEMVHKGTRVGADYEVATQG